MLIFKERLAKTQMTVYIFLTLAFFALTIFLLQDSLLGFIQMFIGIFFAVAHQNEEASSCSSKIIWLASIAISSFLFIKTGTIYAFLFYIFPVFMDSICLNILEEIHLGFTLFFITIAQYCCYLSVFNEHKGGLIVVDVLSYIVVIGSIAIYNSDSDDKISWLAANLFYTLIMLFILLLFII